MQMIIILMQNTERVEASLNGGKIVQNIFCSF